MRMVLLIFTLLLSLNASSLGDKISNSTDSEEQILSISKNINKTIVNIVAISTYSLFLKDKIVFYSQKQKELVSLIKE